jgi:hypothetical protein
MNNRRHLLEPAFLLTLIGLSALTAPSPTEAQTRPQSFYQYFMDSREPGSLHYWFDGDGRGSEYYWFQSRDRGSEYYWFQSREPGSEYYWLQGDGYGSEYHWRQGTGTWSEHGWSNPGSCMSEYEWYHEAETCRFSTGFRVNLVAICLGARLDIEPCRLMWRWADSHDSWGWAYRRGLESNAN